MKRIITTIFTLISLCCFSQAQEIDRSNHQLLWEITGNDFQKPSYLFGSMHVEDERVFEFSDSMLVCLENCEGFSGELNMDSMVCFIMEQMFSGDTSNVLKDLLSPEAYEGLNRKLMNKNGKSIDDLDNKQPWIIDMMMDDDPEKKETDFESFLDLFLFNYAKKKGLKTYGLEDIEDQLSLSLLKYQTYEEYLIDSPSEIKKVEANPEDELEQLKQIYLSGDIRVIDELYVNSMPDDIYKQKLLTDRNIVMADNIEILGNQMPMFNVVGAAHLPGNMGVIDLLQKRGYKVRPVTADFTGKNQLEDVSDVVLPWQALDLKEEMECTMEFPVRAIRLKEFEDTDLSELEFYISMDLYTQEVFFFMGLELPDALDKEKETEFLESSLNRMFLENEEIEVKKIEDPIDVQHQGFSGKEIKGTTTEGGSFSGRAFTQNGMVYYMYVMSGKGEVKNASRFFESLEIFPSLQGEVKGRIVDEDYAIAFVAPVPLEYSIIESVQNVEDIGERTLDIHQYQGANDKSGVFYTFQYYDMVEGAYLEDMNAVVEGISARFKDKGAGEIKLTENKRIGNANYQHMSFEFNTVFFEIDFCFRGSRVLFSMVVGETEKQAVKESKAIFDSLELLDFKPNSLEKNIMKAAGAEIYMPPGSEIVESDETDETSYPYVATYQIMSADEKSASSYVFEVVEMSEYYELENIDTFLIGLKNEFSAGENEIIYSKLFDFKGQRTLDISQKSPSTNVVTEMRITVIGNWVYFAYLYVPVELSRTAYVETYFNSMSFDTSFKRVDMLSSKSKKILDDLKSTNIETFDAATLALDYHLFEDEDLSLLYEAFEQKMPLDTTTDYTVKEFLLEEFESVYDEKTVSFLKKHFAKSTTEQQIEILRIIGAIEKTPHTVYWELISKIDFSSGDYYTYDVVKHFYNEPQMMVDEIKPLMELSRNKYFSADIYSLFMPMIRQDSVDWKTVMKPYETESLNLLTTTFEQWKSDGSAEDGNQIDLMQFITRLHSAWATNEAFFDFVQKNIKDSKYYLFSDMAKALLKNDIPLENDIWERLEKEHLLYIIVDALTGEDYDYSKIDLIPKKYKNQETAAQLGMMMTFEYDYTVGEIELLKTEKFKQGKESYIRYVYKIKRPNKENDNIIGIVVYPSNKKMYQMYPLYYDFGSLDTSTESLDEKIKELMTYFENE